MVVDTNASIDVPPEIVITGNVDPFNVNLNLTRRFGHDGRYLMPVLVDFQREVSLGEAGSLD